MHLPWRIRHAPICGTGYTRINLHENVSTNFGTTVVIQDGDVPKCVMLFDLFYHEHVPNITYYYISLLIYAKYNPGVTIYE